MRIHTNYQRDGDCGTLINYLHEETHNDEGVRNPLGKLMTREERDEWIDWSGHQMMHRLITLSPHPTVGCEMTDATVSLNTRKTINKYLRENLEARYVFAVHRNSTDAKDVPHVHVVLAGTDDSVKMYDRRRKQLSAIAAEVFNEDG